MLEIMMKFKELTVEGILQKLHARYTTISTGRLSKYFGEIKPNRDNKELSLTKFYKPRSDMPDLFNNYISQLVRQTELLELMREKLKKQGFPVNNPRFSTQEATLKLHISLNDINEIDESLINGLMEFLIEESASPNNNISFSFKFIDPVHQQDIRMHNTDQFTLYFDRHTSAGDLARFAQKVEEYLLSQGLPKNTIDRGPKDCFIFNSFVSARFDNLILINNQYGVYNFFDLEIEKFFKNHSLEELNVPLCIFDAVLNAIILLDEVEIIQADPLRENNPSSYLSPEASKAVQAEFEKMLVNPIEYLTNYKIGMGSKLQKNLDERKSRNTPFRSELTMKQHNKLDLLLKKIEKKASKLQEEGYSDKALVANVLYEKLTTAFKLYKSSSLSQNDYSKFKSSCDKAIDAAKPYLKDHRGWKNIFINLAIGIASLGAAFLFNYIHTKGSSVFFKTNTDSMNTMNQIDNKIQEQGLKFEFHDL